MSDQADIKASFGEALRETRLAAGLSQERLARQAGLDRSYVSLLERGVRQPTLRTIFALSIQMDVLPSDLISSVEDMLI